MPQSRSAGILLYRRTGAEIEVLLVRPGGPFWNGRDEGSWQIPKGAIETGETAIEAAIRELREETGVVAAGEPHPLRAIRQAGGKHVEAFGLEQDWDVAELVSGEIEIVWPPRSGKTIRIPEVAEARWVTLTTARTAMLLSQRPILDSLVERLALVR